jgi:MarR family transcriptional regulator for hemolysin
MRVMNPITFDIGETARLIRRDFDRRAATLGATRAQWQVLARLARFGDGVRQVDLAEALDVEPISLCRMIDRLEQAGLVERRKDEEDRRAWRIHLTPKASPIIEELQALGDVFHGDVLAGISREDLDVAHRVLGRIRDNLSKCGANAARKVS